MKQRVKILSSFEEGILENMINEFLETTEIRDIQLTTTPYSTHGVTFTALIRYDEGEEGL